MNLWKVSILHHNLAFFRVLENVIAIIILHILIASYRLRTVFVISRFKELLNIN